MISTTSNLRISPARLGASVSIALLVSLGAAPGWAEPTEASAEANAAGKQGGKQAGEQADEAAKEPKAAVAHHPVAELTSGQKVRIDAEVSADWKLDAIWVAARPMNSQGDWERVELERVGSTEFAAVLPDRLSRPPGVEYYLASRDKAGHERYHFTSPEHPYHLLIEPTEAEISEEHRLERYDGDRSRFALTFDYTAYGRRTARSFDSEVGGSTTTDAYSDTYWVGELEYTYRVLSWLHDFRFGIGRLRGSQPTVTLDGTTEPVIEGRADPGYDYGFGEANIAIRENFSLGFKLILGASEDGFAAGAGAVARIGRISGTRFEVGGELQGEIGNRGWMGFYWDTVPEVPMGLTIELNQRPTDSGPTGTRLIYDIGLEATEAITLNGRVGYASRSGAIEGGFVGGVGAAYEF